LTASEDILFQGSVAGISFANSLQVRMAMTMAVTTQLRKFEKANPFAINSIANDAFINKAYPK
jgi:hypothetical protein